MNIQDALKGANPDYQRWVFGKNPYNTNCQRCVVAYELRRRGRDVKAKPNPGDARYPYEIFTDKDGNDIAFSPGYTETEIKKFTETAPNGARHCIYTKWDDGSGDSHVFISENENGKTIYADPQNGSDDVSWYFANGKKNSFRYFRMDDKQIKDDENLINEFVEVKL